MSRQEAFKQLTHIAHRAAAKYRYRLPPHECTEDLVNVALMGVWEAVDRRYEQGIRAMTSLAFIRAYGAIADYLRQRDWATRYTRKLGRPHTMAYLDSYEEGKAPVLSAMVVTTTPEDEAAANQVNGRKAIALEAALEALKAGDRYIVRRLLAGAKQIEIARELEVSGARISQILAEVLPLIKKSIKAASSHKELW